jgi:hypothetical protein
MPIQETKALKATCDKCNKEFISYQGISLFKNPDSIMHDIQDKQWKAQRGQLLCLKCFDVHSDDENINELKIMPLKAKRK